MLYEHRVYQPLPGRARQLESRFRDVTVPLMDRHGVEAIGFWTSEGDAEEHIHCLLRWRDLEERERKWLSLTADADWLRGRALAEADGPLVARLTNEFWHPAPFSPLP